MKKIVLPKKLVEKIENNSSRFILVPKSRTIDVEKENLYKLTKLMLRKIEKSNTNAVPLSQKILRDEFNSMYQTIIDNAIRIDLIKVVPYKHIMDIQGKEIHTATFISSKRAGLAKKFAFVDAEYMTAFTEVEISEENIKDKRYRIRTKNKEYEDIYNQVKSLIIDEEALIKKLPEWAEKKVNEIIEITDKNVGKNYLEISLFGQKKEMTYKKAKSIAQKNNLQILKDGNNNFFIDDVEEFKKLKYKRSYDFNFYNIKKLKAGDYDYPKRNNKNARVNYILTNISSELLKEILLMNNKMEIDYSCSQYSSFSNLLSFSLINNNPSPEPHLQGEFRAPVIDSSSFSSPSGFGFSPCVTRISSNSLWIAVTKKFQNTLKDFITYSVTTIAENKNDVSAILKEENEKFDGFCFSDTLYESAGNNRTEGKLKMMEVFFLSEKNPSKQKKEMKQKLPFIMKFIDFYKDKNGNEYLKLYPNKKKQGCFPVMLQQLESVLFVDGVYPSLRNKNLFCLTKHDSLIIDKDKYEEAIKLITHFFHEIGFKYHFKNSAGFPAVSSESNLPLLKEASFIEEMKTVEEIKKTGIMHNKPPEDAYTEEMITFYLKQPNTFHEKFIAEKLKVSEANVTSVKELVLEKAKSLEDYFQLEYKTRKEMIEDYLNQYYQLTEHFLKEKKETVEELNYFAEEFELTN